MFQPWRLKLREAEEAFKRGRLEEASQLLCQGDLREFLPAKRLLAQVAGKLAERGKQRADLGETSAGWRDLEQAAMFGADSSTVGAFKTQIAEEALAEVEQYLLAGDVGPALSRLGDLLRRNTAHRESRVLKQVALKMESAHRLARQGRFPEAEALWAGAVALRPDLAWLKTRHEECQCNAVESRRLTEALHQALSAENWTAALTHAEALLALAPDSEPARDARRRAWQAVGATEVGSRKSEVGNQRLEVRGRFPSPDFRLPTSELVNGTPHHSRFILWVDAVGGFLVCDNSEVVLGQPVPGSSVDIPILGDLSRRHAVIRRDAGGYLLEPLRETRVHGRVAAGSVPLVDGSLIEMGEGVRLRFRKPHPLSASARLEFVSRHRTQPAADAVLLMAESLVLGPGANCHVQCRDWARDVVIFRHGDERHFRTAGHFTIDGIDYEGRGQLTNNARVAGDGFSLSLEQV
ncbi:MAG: FHA domain-containing protein [Planctomycetes bacterium]|nr:FHA domain-containing protein [Planctomycetota bacterium]